MSRRDRPGESTDAPAVRTTIVGGRPPGPGKEIGSVPRGLEVLVRKAAVDPEFREVLLGKRAGAAEEIGLDLDPAEAAMLAAIPVAQLEAIIGGTKVDDKIRPAFLGRAAAVMIAALGVGMVGCEVGGTRGIQPDRPPKVKPAPEKPSEPPSRPAPAEKTRGIRPDRPKPRTEE